MTDQDLVVVTQKTGESVFDRHVANAVNNHRPDLLSHVPGGRSAFTGTGLSRDEIDHLADCPQDSLDKTLRINRIISKLENKDDIIGLVSSAIRSNVNSRYRLSYKNFDNQATKMKKLCKAKRIITSFNDMIDLHRLIRTSVPDTFSQGTYIMYLRHQDDNYTVDFYPLGVARIAPYSRNGEPVVMIDMKELLVRFMYAEGDAGTLKLRDHGEEIKMFYPQEVYDAYMKRERYAVLDPKYTGVLRIDNHNHKYGLTPMFRALNSIVMLEGFDEADNATSRIKAKKILLQTMRDKILGENGDRKGYEDMAYAHSELVRAVTQKKVAIYRYSSG